MNLSNKSMLELMKLRDSIESNPENHVPRATGSIYLYTKEARRKLDLINRAITDRIREARVARGETINCAGYSGRQTNKRR